MSCHRTSSIEFIVIVLVHQPRHTKVSKLHYTLRVHQTITRGNIPEKRKSEKFNLSEASRKKLIEFISLTYEHILTEPNS